MSLLVASLKIFSVAPIVGEMAAHTLYKHKIYDIDIVTNQSDLIEEHSHYAYGWLPAPASLHVKDVFVFR